MDCKSIRDLLTFTKPQLLDSQTVRELDLHCSACPPCSAYRQALLRVEELIAADGEDGPSPFTLKRIRDAAAAQVEQRKSRRAHWQGARYSLPAAAAVLLILGAWWFSSSSQQQARQVVARPESNRLAQFVAGKEAFERADYQTAETSLLGYFGNKPGLTDDLDYIALVTLARSQQLLGRYPDAVQSYQKILGSPNVLVNRSSVLAEIANCQMRMGNYAEAEATMKEFRKVHIPMPQPQRMGPSPEPSGADFRTVSGR